MRIERYLGPTLLALTPWACATGVEPEGDSSSFDAGPVPSPGPSNGPNTASGMAGSNTSPPIDTTPEPSNPGSAGNTSSGGSAGSQTGGSAGSTMTGGMGGGGSAGAAQGGGGAPSEGGGGSSSAGAAGSDGGQSGGPGSGGATGGCGPGGDPCACQTWSSGTEYTPPNDIATITCEVNSGSAPCSEHPGDPIAVRCGGDIEACKYQTPNGFGPAGVWDFIQEC